VRKKQSPIIRRFIEPFSHVNHGGSGDLAGDLELTCGLVPIASRENACQVGWSPRHLIASK
jgi:hypothetical protein